MIRLFCKSRAILHFRQIDTPGTGTREAPSHLLGHRYSAAAAAVRQANGRERKFWGCSKTSTAGELRAQPAPQGRPLFPPACINPPPPNRPMALCPLSSSSVSEVNRKSLPAAPTRERRRGRGHRLLPGDDIVSVLMFSLLLNPPKPPPTS